MPKISVIIPVYRVEKYLARCLDSVMAQTFKDFEVICVNDGSPDNCGDILKQYEKRFNNIKVISQENKGLSAARNAALPYVTGEYVTFIDSDDFIHPQFLEHLYNVQQMTNCDIVGCDFKKIKKSKDCLCGNINKVKPKIYANALKVLLNKRNFIHFNVWNKLYKREVINDILFVSGMYYEDWVYNCCVFERAENFAWIKDCLYGYQLSDNSIMRSKMTAEKIDSYVLGIKTVYDYFMQHAPEKWEEVKQTRIARTVKMMMNHTKKAKNQELSVYVAKMLNKLKNEKLICYKGLSLKNKFKLFRFLSMVK